jgi:hypothetical protein
MRLDALAGDLLDQLRATAGELPLRHRQKTVRELFVVKVGELERSIGPCAHGDELTLDGEQVFM